MAAVLTLVHKKQLRVNIHKRNDKKHSKYKYTYYQKTHTLQNPHIHTPTHYKTHTYTHPNITKPTHTHNQTLQNPHIHTPTHYKTHTYTHPHIVISRYALFYTFDSCKSPSGRIKYKARSCNHCCGKAIVLHMLSAFVALGIQHAMRMHHSAICGVSSSTIFFYIV